MDYAGLCYFGVGRSGRNDVVRAETPCPSTPPFLEETRSIHVTAGADSTELQIKNPVRPRGVVGEKQRNSHIANRDTSCCDAVQFAVMRMSVKR